MSTYNIQQEGEIILTKLGKAIQLRRVKLDINIKDMAEKADISYSYYREIERGAVEPSIKMLAKICNVLEVSLWVIFKEAEELQNETVGS